MNRDPLASAQLMHPDIVVRYPQSGEVIKGRDNYVAMLSNYPSGLPEGEIVDIRGEREAVQVSRPLPFGPPIITVMGSGDTFIIEGTTDYADMGRFNLVAILKLDDGLVSEEVWYWAAPFDAPEWRRPFVEG